MFTKGLRALPARALVVALLTLCVAAPSAHAGMTGLEYWASVVAHNEVGTAVESPAGSDHVVSTSNGSVKPYNINAAWCAAFITWVLQNSNVPYYASGRGYFNQNYVPSWAAAGANGGGYKRAATAHDAMPGDLLIDNANTSSLSGGSHISMVVKVISGNIVWTVGGNESNQVRYQQKDLNASSRILITLAEFRHQKIDLAANGTKYGTTYVDRFMSPYGPMAQVTRIDYNGVYTGASLHNTWTVSAHNATNNTNPTYAGDQPMSSLAFDKATIYCCGGWSPYSQFLYPDPF